MNSFSTVEKLLAKQSYPTIEKKPEHRLEAEVILLEYGVKKDSEPPRDCRRPNILREYDNEKTNLYS